MFDVDTVLVLAPHTDDAEFGCGGTLAKVIATGKRVIQVAFSAAETSLPPHLPQDTLRTECQNAASVIGIDEADCRILDFQVRRFPEFRQQVLDSMIQIGREVQPDLVLLPSLNDTHQDHKVVAEEGYRAFKRVSMLGYELPWNNLDFRSGCFIKLEEADLQRKIEAIQCYDSQAQRSYSSPEFIRSLAHMRGTQIGCKYAECFEVIRWVAS